MFRTAVHGIDGVWPSPPDTWSYSSLTEAEECPRRWMLSRASYPKVWNRKGYPPRPILPALVGDVVHRSLELILLAMHSDRCESLADPCAADVLRRLGGYSGLVDSVIEQRLSYLENNPRVSDQLSLLRTSLRSRLPDIRQRIQMTIARTTITPVELPSPSTTESTQPGPLSNGSHPEVDLRAPKLRFAGRADLVTITNDGCVITDYKTGTPHEGHAEQVRTYALLWMEDTTLNPQKLPARLLVLSYATHDDEVMPPTDDELEEMANLLTSRVSKSEEELALRPPPARPSAEVCFLCGVRQLCDEYWIQLPESSTAHPSIGGVEFADCEVLITSRNGPRSWLAQSNRSRDAVLLRTPTEDTSLEVGRRLRLLNIIVSRDDELGRTTLTMTRSSEAFVLDTVK